MENLSVVQFLLTLVGTIIFPVVALYVKNAIGEGQRRIDERMAALELGLEKRFGDVNIHINESETRWQNFDMRVSMLESNWRTVHDRFDQVQLNIASSLREISAGVNAPGHGTNTAKGSGD
jgi:hypothetical protein